MATLQELEAAFIAADDAGNHEDAQAFATEIRRMRSETQNPFANLADRQRQDYQNLQSDLAAAESAPSQLGSFTREAARSVAPGLAGFATGAGTGALAGAAGANPVTVGIGAVAGGIMGAMGAREVQDTVADAVAPDSFMGTQSAALDYQTNPVSSLIGGAIAQGKPAPFRAMGAAKNIATAEGRSLLASSLKSGASPAARAALNDVADVGLGAGIGGGISLATGDGMAMENAAIGALFNKPWIGGGVQMPPAPEAPNTNTGIIPVAPEVIRGPVTRMGNGEIMEPPISRLMPMRPALPAPESPSGYLPSPPPTSGLPAPVEGARRSPAVVDLDQEVQRGKLINELEDEFVQNRARREKLGRRFKDDGKALNSGDGRKMITLLDARANAIESQLKTLRAGEIITPPPQTREIVEVDNRPLGTKPGDRLPLTNNESEQPSSLPAPQQSEVPLSPLPAPAESAAIPDPVQSAIIPAPELRDTDTGSASTAARPESLTSEALPQTADVESSRRYARAGTIESDPHSQDFIDFVADHRINIPADKSGGEYNGFSEWHQSIPPLYKSERHFSRDSGSPIDVVANEAFKAGHIDSPDPALLMDKYTKSIADRKLNRTTGDLNPLEAKALSLEKKAPRQAREFDTALIKNRRSRAGEKVMAGDLSEGETFMFDGERFKVTRSDTVEGFDGPEGLVVIQDHDRFGTQVVDASQPLRIADKDKGTVWQHESDRADQVIQRRAPVEQEEIVDAYSSDDAWELPSSLAEKPKASSEMDAKNMNARQLFDDDGGFSLAQEKTEDGSKVSAERSSKEESQRLNDEAQGKFFDETPEPEAAKSIIESLKQHRASIDKSIKDGRGKSYMSMTGISPQDVKLIYRAALDLAISTLEAGQSVRKAVQAALAHVKQAAPRITAEESKQIENRLYAEANDSRRFANGRDASLKVEMPKVARDLEAKGITNPTMGQIVSELSSRFPDQAGYIRKNADKIFDEMIFQTERMKGKSAKAREWSDWLDAGLEQASNISDWAKRGTPFRDIAGKLNLFNRTFFGTIGSKMHALADGSLTGKASPAFQRFVNEFVGLKSGSGGVHQVSLDHRLKTDTTAFGNTLDGITARIEGFTSKMPKSERTAFYERVTDHITDPSRDAELKSQPELKQAVEDFIKLRRDLYEMKKAAGVDMGDAGPRSMPRRPEISKILGHEKEFVAQAAKAYKATWRSEIQKLNAERAAAVASGDKAEVSRIDSKIGEIDARDADTYAKQYLYALQSDGIGLSSDGNGDLFTPHNGNPSTEKSRVFGPEADQFLGKFYERSAIDLLARDINDSVRAATVAKALSAKSPDGKIDPLGRWKEMRAEMEAEGNRDLVPMAAELLKNYFNLGGHENPKIRRFLELAHTHTQIGRLSHAMLSSLGEPVTVGMRHGGGIPSIAKSYAGVAKSFVRRLRAATPSEWQIIGNFMGSTTGGMNSLLIASRHMDAFGGRTGGKLVSRFHVLTMLTDFTNATHEMALQMGHAHILGQLETAKAGGTYSTLARKLLNEVGITGKEIDDVLKFAKQLEGTADKARLLTADTPEAKKYRDALHLFRDSGASLEPTRGTRPEYANTPLGTVFYQLSSFLYNFHEKVTLRSLRHLRDAAKGATLVDGSMVPLSPAERVKMTKNILTGVAAIAAAQYGIQNLRELLLADPIRIEKDKKRTASEKQATKLMSAASRTGFLGPYDMLFNMITGARYQRDPASALMGPALGGASELFGNVVRLIGEEVTDATNDRTTPRSNMTARKVGRNISDMIVTPAMSAAGATMPGRIVGGSIIQGASHPAFREAVTKTIGGPLRIEK